jgi:hypothetical protein
MYVPMYVKWQKEYKGLGKLEPTTLGNHKAPAIKKIKNSMYLEGTLCFFFFLVIPNGYHWERK